MIVTATTSHDALIIIVNVGVIFIKKEGKGGVRSYGFNVTLSR